MPRKRLFLDFETGGLDPNTHAALQMAGLIEIDGKVEEEFNFYMHPFADQKVEDGALLVSGLTRDEIAGFPMPDVCFREFISILSKYIDYWNPLEKFTLYAYNTKFDEGFLRKFFLNNTTNKQSYAQGNGYGNFFHNASVDVMGLAAEALEDHRALLENFKLITVHKFMIGTDFGGAHNAIHDIRATRNVYYVSMQLIKEKTWQRL